MTADGKPDRIWIFGYGSLIWRPDLPFTERRVAQVRGWVRRFWQGSHDHRGRPDAPGRVVTLIPQSSDACEGVAYCLRRDTATAILDRLDDRERNGYRRHGMRLEFRGGGVDAGTAYVAPADNPAFLGPAPLEEMAAQIARADGPSGTNVDYVRRLAAALRRFGIDDSHVFELADRLRKTGSLPPAANHTDPPHTADSVGP